MDITAPEAVRQGVYGFYLADRARQLADEFRLICSPGMGVNAIELAQWAGRASVALALIADEYAQPEPANG